MIKDIYLRISLFSLILFSPTIRIVAQSDSIHITYDDVIHKFSTEHLQSGKISKFQKWVFYRGNTLSIANRQKKMIKPHFDQLPDSIKQILFNTSVLDLYTSAFRSNIPRKVWYTDLYLYGSYWGYKNGNLWTAMNNTGAAKSDCYLTNADIGLSLDCYQRAGWFFEGNLGYSHLSLDKSRHLFNSAVSSHMLTLDANIGSSYWELLAIGLRSNFRIYTNHRNKQDNTFVGFYNDCFNDVTLMPYITARLRLQYFKISACAGFQWIPFLDANKIAYHNMHKTYVNRLFYEIQCAFRLFTTSNPYRHVNSSYNKW